jgi:hypothetical protein
LRLYRRIWSLTRRPLPISARFRSRLNNGDKCIKPKIDIHRNFVNPLLSKAFSLQLIGGTAHHVTQQCKGGRSPTLFQG